MTSIVSRRCAGTSTSFLDFGWIARLRAFFGFGSSKAPLPITSSRSSAPIPTPKPVVAPPSQQPAQSAKMHTSITNLVASRIPMIKFVGARLPRPNFNASALPSIPIGGSFGGAPLVAAKPTSIGAVGKIPRGQGIPESQLPKKFRRQPIDQEECDAINNGGIY